jgi:hypothetical protein
VELQRCLGPRPMVRRWRRRTRGVAGSCLGRPTPRTGSQRLRLQVILASAIPVEACRAENLGYPDPASVDVAAFAADPDAQMVPRAGEMLFRLN